MLITSIDKIKENGFELTKKTISYRCRQRRWHSDSGQAQAETLLHSLERASAGISLHVNAHKTEYMCFNQTGDISTLNGSSLNLVDKFTYLGSSVSSTETDIDTQLTKAWTAINRLSVIWNSDLTDKLRRSFFQAAIMLILQYGCTTWTLNNGWRKSLTATTQECWEQYWRGPGGNTP